ncbi:MAG: hypothetical protein OXU69_02555 [Gemmatimonadota bacterium]|nr:hypothetical protein [Gemmatimonadota bacterium]MDE2983562.1 hypothetical protein [Gemmatimonadota bacterium]
MGISSGRVLALPALVLVAACDDHSSRSAYRTDAPWLSEPAYQIGDAFAGDVLFGLITWVRASPDSRRVYVLEPYEARVSVWTPEDELDINYVVGRRLVPAS